MTPTLTMTEPSTDLTDPDRAFARYRRTGSPDDFAAFHDVTVEELLGLARQKAPGPEAAEDVVQRTYLAAIEGQARFDGRRGVMPWLVGILQNQCRIQRWRAGRKVDRLRLEWPEPIDPALAAEDREFAEMLEAALDRLGPVYRPVMILHLQHELTAKEIGKVLDRPAGTVRTQVVRGMTMLRNLLPASVASGLLLQPVPAAMAPLRDVVSARAALAPPAGAAGGVAWAIGLLVVAVAGAATWLSGWGRGDAPVLPAAQGAARESVTAAAKAPVERRAEHRVPVVQPTVETAGAPQDKPAAITEAQLFGTPPEHAGAAGGRYGGRQRGRARMAQRRPAFGAALEGALRWLARHQAEDGRWDADGFALHDDPTLGPATDGRGAAGKDADVEVTALALLAMAGDGEHAFSEGHGAVIRRAVVWLVRQQDAAGLFTKKGTPRSVLRHALATDAIGQVYGAAGGPAGLRPRAARAVGQLIALQGKDGAWRDQDMGADLSGAATAFAALAWSNALQFGVVEPDPVRWAAVAAPDEAPAGRAAGLVVQFFAHADKLEREAAGRDAAALVAAVPAWESRGDLTAWLLGSWGIYQTGGTPWSTWQARLIPLLIERQRVDGNFSGSWDPDPVHNRHGGRVHATAMAALCLESPYIYTRLVR